MSALKDKLTIILQHLQQSLMVRWRRPAQSRDVAPVMRRDDQEFLPTALEILERPASPLGKGLIYFIMLIVVSALLWSWFGETDIVAVGSGKVQPAGRVKTVQVAEVGRVKQILAVNGQHVRAGDPVAEVEPYDALADKDALAAVVFTSRAEVVRRNHSVRAVRDPGLARKPVAWPSDIPTEFTALQERVMGDELGAVLAHLAAIDAQKQQKQAELAKLKAVVASQKELLQILQERVQMRTELVARNDVSRLQLMEAQEALAQQTTSYVGQVGTVAETERALAVLDSEAQKVRQGFLADNMAKLAEAEKLRSEASQRLIKADIRLERTVLRSPVEGVVHGSSLTSVGQVLTPAQEVMRIVPDAQDLEIEVYLPNRDVGFIQVGQMAAIKVESFPFTRYGTLEAIVTHVARDAVPEADARQTEADAARAVAHQEVAGAQRVQGLVFPVTLKTRVRAMNVDGRMVELVPGMAVTAEIKTGHRRVLEYLFTPLLEVTNRAMRER